MTGPQKYVQWGLNGTIPDIPNTVGCFLVDVCNANGGESLLTIETVSEESSTMLVVRPISQTTQTCTKVATVSSHSRGWTECPDHEKIEGISQR